MRNPPPCGPRRLRVNALSFAKMMAALAEGGATQRDLVEHTGLCSQTVREYVYALKREGVIRVSAWERDTLGRCCTPAYSIGGGFDARKDTLDKATRARLYRARKEQAALLHAIAGQPTTEEAA
jgi:DNA-binding IclR family transcriptional regulator